MTVEYDVNTGLPKLPEGQFFRVHPVENMFAGTLLKVQIRKKVWFFSVQLEVTYGRPSLLGTPEATFKWLAEELVKERVVVLTDRQKSDLIAGDYPPKSLGGKNQ